MRNFDDTTLWRVSTFERVQQETGTSGFARLDGPTLLPTTLLAELEKLERNPLGIDVLEMLGACMRHREAALLCLQHDELVWPITVFPMHGVYHSPKDMNTASISGLAALKVLTAEPPGVQPPGHWERERVSQSDQYRPLVPLLWFLALNGPRVTLLNEINGPAAYRALAGRGNHHPTLSGTMGSALERLHHASVSLKQITAWPGMTQERASRLLNGLYLISDLMITRAHHAARDEPGQRSKFLDFAGSLFGRRRE
jgi:hypothetical protein